MTAFWDVAQITFSVWKWLKFKLHLKYAFIFYSGGIEYEGGNSKSSFDVLLIVNGQWTMDTREYLNCQPS